jgi:hypothetical protein
MTMMTAAPINQTAQSSASSELFKGFSSLSSRLTSGFKEAGIGANLENLISGVKNFLPVNKDLTLTRVVESIMGSCALSNSKDLILTPPTRSSASVDRRDGIDRKLSILVRLPHLRIEYSN